MVPFFSFLPPAVPRPPSPSHSPQRENPGNTKLEVSKMLPVDPRDLLVPTLLDRKDDEHKWFLYHCKRFPEARGILVNSFLDLEPSAFKALAGGDCLPGGRTPALYAVGPMLGKPETVSGDGGSDHKCLKWLDQQPDGSVVFLCFGSQGAFAAEQIKEIARGLELSGHRFLWSVLPPSHRLPGFSVHATADPLEALPSGFIQRTKGRGLVWSGWMLSTLLERENLDPFRPSPARGPGKTGRAGPWYGGPGPARPIINSEFASFSGGRSDSVQAAITILTYAHTSHV
ncbi:UDP-glycosyltransferase [Nymphaea thermarum]|nr:UDP-glycosyltransferase [Nymphaea thermarum]